MSLLLPVFTSEVNDRNCVIYRCCHVIRGTLCGRQKLTVSQPLFFFVSDARILQNKHRESNRGNRDERISSTVSRKGKTSSECCIALSKSLLQRFIAFTEDCLFTDVNRKRWNIINISVTARETWSSFAVVCSEKKKERKKEKRKRLKSVFYTILCPLFTAVLSYFFS